MKTPVAFIHTSPAAIPPIMRFYGEAAPDLLITNLLDDGILRCLSASEHEKAQRRLTDMIDTAVAEYGARTALVTCSSVPSHMARDIEVQTGIPVLKIDDPMAEEAVRTGRRIGVAITFAPTTVPTQKLLNDAAATAGTTVELNPLLVEGAYDALLGGKAELHDTLLLEGLEKLERAGADAIVLAQVSMARILPRIQGRVGVPVLSSLTSSLGALRRVLGEQA